MTMGKHDISCPECGEMAILTDTHWVCPNDGLVIQPKFEQGSVLLEETANTYGKRFAAVSNDPQRFIRMGTTVGWKSSETRKDAHRSLIDLPVRQQYKVLQWRNDKIARLFSDERLARWLELYNRACNVLNLPLTLQKDGATLLRKVHDNSVKYQRMNGIIAAVIYLICRYRQYVIPLATIEESFCQMGYPTSGKDIVKCAMQIRKITQLRIRPFGPRDYLSSLIEQLRNSRHFEELIKKMILPKKQHKYWLLLQKTATEVIVRVSPKELSNRNPRVLAAAAIVGADTFLAQLDAPQSDKIYIENRKRGVLTQTLVAQLLEIREYTLREHYLIAIKPALTALQKNVIAFCGEKSKDVSNSTQAFSSRFQQI